MRTLLITSVLPWPLRRNGGAQRTALLRDALSRHGEVDILAVGGETLRDDAPDFEQQLPQHGVVGCVVCAPAAWRRPWFMPGPLGNISNTVHKFTAPYEVDPHAASTLKSCMQQHPYDLIVSRYLQPAMQCGIGRYPDVPAVLDFDDIDWLTLAAQIAANPWGGFTGQIAAGRVISRVTAIGQAALEQFKHIFVTSAEDAAKLSRPATLLPNIPFAENAGEWLTALPTAAGERVLFVGDLQFPPNRDGLDRFLARVWPAVKSARPAATMAIVGRGISEANRAKWSQAPGIEVVGFAEDLMAYYRDCALAVVPIYFGGGTKIKILEALAFGRPVVTTPQSMRGYSGLAGVAVADDDASFADNVIRLLADPAERQTLAEHGRADVVLNFSPLRFQRVVDEMITNVFGRSAKEAVASCV